MSPNDAIFNQLRQVIADEFSVDPETIVRATTALDVNRWDSLAHSILILHIEERFDVELPLDEIFKLRDVGELAALVAREVDARRA